MFAFLNVPKIHEHPQSSDKIRLCWLHRYNYKYKEVDYKVWDTFPNFSLIHVVSIFHESFTYVSTVFFSHLRHVLAIYLVRYDRDRSGTAQRARFLRDIIR